MSQIDLNYVVYHLHSDLSNGVTNVDSVTKFKEYIEKAKEFGMKAMAFSEHGSVFEWYHKKEAIEAAGMKCVGENPDTHLVEVVEVPSLTWYIGVQYHPEYNSTVLNPNPLFLSFIKAIIDHKK